MAIESRFSDRTSSNLAKLLGFFAPALIPPLHIIILYYFWSKYTRKVDKRFCSCSCWDTVFKGTYESGIASYKHMYFNATTNSFKIWIVTVIFILGLYECIRHLTSLALHRQLRISMLILFLSSIFAHYYSWWGYINYWNDDFYLQWNHQLFFTVTEIFSTILVINLANKREVFSLRKALGIVGIAALHVLAGGWDQFVSNVVRGEGHAHQVTDEYGQLCGTKAPVVNCCLWTIKTFYIILICGLVVRDVALMVPDLLHFTLPLLELRQSSFLTRELQKELLGLILFVTIGFLICEQL